MALLLSEIMQKSATPLMTTETETTMETRQSWSEKCENESLAIEMSVLRVELSMAELLFMVDVFVIVIVRELPGQGRRSSIIPSKLFQLNVARWPTLKFAMRLKITKAQQLRTENVTYFSKMLIFFRFLMK